LLGGSFVLPLFQNPAAGKKFQEVFEAGQNAAQEADSGGVTASMETVETVLFSRLLQTPR
jgi:hypothetical protein